MSRYLMLTALVISLASSLLAGCSSTSMISQATATPLPTYTPQPTYTPPPTYTPVPTYTPNNPATPAVTSTVPPPQTSETIAQYTPWPTPVIWPTPTPVPGVSEEVEYYVQDIVPYMEYMVYGLQAIEQAMYAYSDGYITIEDVNATLEIYNEIVINAYEGILATVPPATLALIQEQIVDELQNVNAVLEMFESTPIEQWDPDSLDEALQIMTQVKDRTQLVDRALSDEISQLGSGERPNLQNLQLQLPEKGELSLPELGEGRLQPEKPERPEKPQVEKPDLPDMERPEIEKPSRPSSRR